MKFDWLCIGTNKKRLVAGVLFAAAFCFAPFGLICPNYGGHIAVKLLVALLFIASGLVSVKLSKKAAYAVYPAAAVLAAVAAVFLSQVICVDRLFVPSVESLLLSSLCVFALYCAIYVITASARWSIAIGTAAVTLLSLANRLVIGFQGNELTPSAILGFRTAMDVLPNYKPELAFRTLLSVFLALVICFGVFLFTSEKSKKPFRVRTAGLAASALLSFAFAQLTVDIQPHRWLTDGSTKNGYILNFALELDELRVSPPNGYSAADVKGLEDKYKTAPSTHTSCAPSDIIVIMNESFSDLSVYGAELNTNTEVLPFFDSLTDNTVRGWAYTSVYGGGTSGSEWEMLTGNTMAFLPTGTAPYQQYIKSPTYSLAGYLGSLGYTGYATHPSDGVNWNRNNAYRYLEFDRIEFCEAYPEEYLIRDNVSDQEMYELMLDRHEREPKDEPLFMFGVTMQNHGGYDFGDIGLERITLAGDQHNEAAENYLTLIHESDKAFEMFIRELEKSDRPTVLLMFGDHQPSLSMDFLEQLHGGALETLDEQMLRYKVPFVIWANYDIDEKTVDCTSLNYLSVYLMEAAGLPLSPYQEFLRDTEKLIPAINSNGYYSLTDGCFLPISDAQGEEKTALNLYAQLQYNSMFDSKHRSEVFFPVQ